MARIIVRSLGPVRGACREAAVEYLQRLQPRLPIAWEELGEVRSPPRASAADEEKVREREAERLLRGVAAQIQPWALDAGGKALDSEAFAELLRAWRESEGPTYLLVGGHLGLHERVKARSQLLSLSRLTFSHQMVPAILFEQIYRAQSILDGGPYHR
jgi:23S rRNA (pseudouridine1915-N3)-methyltransferase